MKRLAWGILWLGFSAMSLLMVSLLTGCTSREEYLKRFKEQNTSAAGASLKIHGGDDNDGKNGNDGDGSN